MVRSPGIRSVLEIKLSMQQPEMYNAAIDAQACKDMGDVKSTVGDDSNEAAVRLKTSLAEAEELLHAIKMNFKNLQALTNDECASA